jgi:hypothetical protein
MAAAALDNASPTILNTSQLPTRQKKLTPRLGPDSKYADLIFSRPSYLSQPFCDGFDDERVWSSPDSSSSSSAGDDFAADPIDEQEIYGTPATSSRALTLSFSHLEVLTINHYRSHLHHHRS